MRKSEKVPDADQTALMADGEGIVRMASAAAAALFGCPARDLEGLRLDELLESPDRTVVEAYLRYLSDGEHAPLGESSARLAARMRLPGGRLVEADLRLTRLPAGSPVPGATLISVELLGQEERHRGALGPGEERDPIPEEVKATATQDAFVISRGDLIQHVGAGLPGLVGVDAASLIGWNIKSLIAAEDLLPVVEILRGVESGESTWGDFGFRLLRAGKLPPLEVAARARRIAHRGGPAVLLGLRDISGSLKAARRAAERLTHLDAALAASSDAVLILGLPQDGSPILLAGPTLESLFGVDGSAWIGRPFWDLWQVLRPMHSFPEDDERVLAALLDDTDQMRLDTVALAGPAGRVLERTFGPMRSTEGEVIGRILTFRDITQRALAEAEMRRTAQEAGRAREELELLHEELRLANEGLERRMAEMHRLNKDLKVLDEMKSNLLANVSHELQTPLVSIKGFTEMILKGSLGGLTPEQERGLQVALRNINRLIGLINNLLEFARSQGPATALRLEVFPLGTLVEEAADLVREKADARRIAIKMAMPPGDLFIRADRDKVLQVMLNLLSNAVKYNRDDGEVVIQAESGRKGSARVEVRDTGIGIPRDEMDRIFDRYYQAANIEGPREGAGIGLSITKSILRQHGCMIRADSEEGKGSVFSFTLPLDRKSRSERTAPRLSGSGASGPAGPDVPPEPHEAKEPIAQRSPEEA